MCTPGWVVTVADAGRSVVLADPAAGVAAGEELVVAVAFGVAVERVRAAVARAGAALGFAALVGVRSDAAGRSAPAARRRRGGACSCVCPVTPTRCTPARCTPVGVAVGERRVGRERARSLAVRAGAITTCVPPFVVGTGLASASSRPSVASVTSRNADVEIAAPARDTCSPSKTPPSPRRSMSVSTTSEPADRVASIIDSGSSLMRRRRSRAIAPANSMESRSARAAASSGPGASDASSPSSASNRSCALVLSCARLPLPGCLLTEDPLSSVVSSVVSSAGTSGAGHCNSVC